MTSQLPPPPKKILRVQTCKPIQKVEDCLGKIGSRKLEEFIIEPKLDGFRIYAHIRANGVDIYTRGHKSQEGKAPHIEKALRMAFPPGTVVDGEIVAATTDAGGNHVSRFDFVQSVMNSYAERARALQEDMDQFVHYAIFDLLVDGGTSISGKPLKERKAALAERLSGEGQHISTVSHVAATEGHDRHVLHLSKGYEGSVVKDLTKPYAQGKRGSGWFKLKVNPTVDVVIVGFDPGTGKFKDTFGAVRFAQFNASGRLVERGACSGMDDATRKMMWDAKESMLGRVMEISHNGLIAGGVGYRFRHPQFVRLRDDKLPEECTWHDS